MICLKHRVVLLQVFMVSGLALCARFSEAADLNWPSFRGSNAGGVSSGASTPETWDVTKSQATLWKTAIPGLGHSSPIIWGNRVFVTTTVSGVNNNDLKIGLYGDIASVADESKHVWKVYCLDKKSGHVVWERVATQGVPKIKRHTKATHANCTMATDGKNLIAFFGSEGLYCYDLKGTLRWKKDLGVLDAGFYMVPSAQWEYASSPIIYDNMVIVQCDVQKKPFLAAYKISNGDEIWRTERDDVPTWCTPTVYEKNGKALLLVNGYKHMGGYDARTGKEIWRLKGGGDIPVPTPVVSNGMVFMMSAHGPTAPIYAVKLEAAGDITLKPDEMSNAYVAWSSKRGGAYMQTPIIIGDYLYTCQINGILTCYEAANGKQVYNERLGTGRTGFTASPVAADGKIYFTSEEGDVYVVRAGPEFKVLATNPLGASCLASPAISGGVIYFRTGSYVVAVGGKP